MALSKLAEKQLIEIQYAFGCGKEKAISYALESLHAFENITINQIIPFLYDNYKKELQEWEIKHENERVKLLNN